jgi:hypothetical protein
VRARRARRAAPPQRAARRLPAAALMHTRDAAQPPRCTPRRAADAHACVLRNSMLNPKELKECARCCCCAATHPSRTRLTRDCCLAFRLLSQPRGQAQAQQAGGQAHVRARSRARVCAVRF